MEEADSLLISQLKLMGIQISKLEQLDSTMLITALIGCFEHISMLLSKDENFIDVRYLKSQNVAEQADKFRVCQKITQYLKTLDYYNDLSFNMFLFPNVKDTRKILAFLFEIMFKDEESEADKSQPTNTYEILWKRRMAKFQKKPWILPEFQKINRPMFIGGGDKIVSSMNLDAARVAACKYKKVKGVFEMMKALSAQGC